MMYSNSGGDISRDQSRIVCEWLMSDSDGDELKAVAFGLSGNLFALLEWWIDHGMVQSPVDYGYALPSHGLEWDGSLSNRFERS